MLIINNNIAQWVTDSIISQLEKGVVPWKKKWMCSGPKNIKGNAYKGLNKLILGSMDYESPYWLTFNQAKALGGSVKAGEHPIKIIFWKLNKYSKVDPDTQDVTSKTIPYMTYYNVYNLHQCNLPEDVMKKYTDTTTVVNPIEEAENIVKNYKDCPPIVYGGDEACYIPAKDKIKCPPITAFAKSSAEDFYGVLFHEMAHSTGSNKPKRLCRFKVNESTMFGSNTYSKEELVAELCSCFLKTQAGINTSMSNSASYIQSWIKVLKDDRSLLISASSKAEEAYQYILGKKVKVTS